MSRISDIENKQRKVMIVDDSPDALALYSKILKCYEVETCKNGIEALANIDRSMPDLIVLDVNMPYVNGIEVCKRIRNRKGDTKYTGIVLISATMDPQLTVEGLEAGADDFCKKPSALEELRARVYSVMRLKVMTDELKKSRVETVTSFVRASEYHDKFTGQHIERMSQYSARIYDKLGFDATACENLKLAAMLHDIGKITTPDSILKKPGSLTSEEFDVMKTHAPVGFEILKEAESPLLQLAANIAHCHHERWDGTGYPRGLKGEDIPLEARIVAVADVFDALLSERCYKESWPVEKTLDTILKGAGTHFDPQIVLVFFDCIDELLLLKKKIENPKKLYAVAA